MTPEQIIKVHSLISREDESTLVDACNLFLGYLDTPERVKTPQEAFTGLYGAFQGFLDSDRKTEAALLCWGSSLFNPEPRAVQMIWEDLEKHNKLLIIGPGGAGKSFTIIAWTLLDWVEDPWGTSTKLISTTAGHARANTFSTLSMLHKESALKLPGVVKDGFIGMATTDKRSSISVVAIPPGDDGKGRLQGFHPIPRAKPHPKFGKKTRVRGVMDEGESIPPGIWQGVDNMLITMDNSGSTKVVGATNPRLRESSFGQRVEPAMGWESIDKETSERWKSKMGWNVLRLDGAKTENVLRHNDPTFEPYPGMMTYEGYMSYMDRGAHHPETDSMARGWYPEGGSTFHVTPRHYFTGAIGVYTWGQGAVTPVASLDPAFADGGDNPVLTAGRYGKAIGFTPVGKDYISFSKPINALQLEQQFTIRKDNTLIMAQEVMNYLRVLQVRPEWFCMDKTGNGLGLHDALMMQFGTILGVQWGESSTDRKILDEDTMTAEERFYGVTAEMAFAFAIWLQYGYIKIAPMMDATKLIAQATGRTYYYGGKGLIHLQSKAAFKADTGGMSPDEYDSAIMLPHLIRIRQSQNAAMLPGHPSHERGEGLTAIRESMTARPDFYDTNI